MRVRSKKFFQFVLICTLSFAWIFSGWPQIWQEPPFPPKVEEAQAAVGDIGHWRDSVGGQIAGTTFGAFQFDSQVRNDGIYTKPDSSTIQLSEAGHYLIIASIRGNDTSNGRNNIQSRVALTSGTGTLFTSYYTGYSRNNPEPEYWTRAVGVLISGSANAQVQIQVRRDTDTPIGGSVVNASDVQVVRISPSNWGIYAIGGTGNAYGGITPNLVDISAVTLESSTLAIQGNITSDTITVKGDNKRYLVAWSVSGNTGGGRTQRIGHLEYDATDDLATRSYCYQRNNANEYCGLGSMDIIETATADRAVQVEVYRGDGVLADQGGADVDSSWVTDGNGQMVVVELPDTMDVFRSHDSTGLQDVTSAVTINAMETVDFNDSASFTQASSSAMNVVSASDIFTWANVWTARNNVSLNKRLTTYGSITVNGVEQSTGRLGNYTRGNQGSANTFGGSFHPAGIYAVAAGDDIGVNMDPLAGTSGGGTDRTQAGTVGFFALKLTEPVVYSVAITSSGVVEYGFVQLSTASSTVGNGYTQTAQNDGTASEKLNVKSSDATGGTTWTLASSIGSDTYKHEFSTTTGSTWDVMPDSSTYVLADPNVAESGTVDFDFRLTVPSDSTDYQEKSITITVQAVAP